jgi:hypothetical protein
LLYKKNTYIAGIFILMLVTALPVFGQNNGGSNSEVPDAPPPVAPTYILGSQNVIIRGGPFIPLFFNNLTKGTVEPANLYMGVIFGLQWQGYLSNDWSIGVELNGTLSFSPNFNILWLLPIGVKGSYTIHIYPFEIPLSLTTGICLESFIESTRIDFFLKPEVSGYWKIDATWGVGLNVGYLWIPPLSHEDQDSVQAGQSFLGNFLMVSIALSFYF